MDGPLARLPDDEPQTATLASADGKWWLIFLTVMLGLALQLLDFFGSWAAWTTLIVGLIVVVLEFRTRVTVTPEALMVRGVWRTCAVSWDAVRSWDEVPGPLWLSFFADSWRAKGRATRWASTATVVGLADGRTLRPLALMHTRPSRAEERVAVLAKRFADVG